MQIEVKQLKRFFHNTKAVNNISFSFHSGQIFGFVGPNGAGKTTTMRIMATLDEPTSGDILVDGISVVEEPELARQKIGFMPDSLPEHRDVCIHEYLDFFARAYGVKGRKRIKLLESIEEFTNLVGIRYKALNSLSKGMKQRVSLARALVHDPPVLVMDEPAAGLDPRARVELRELLKALSDRGKAILISSHILTELAEVCNGAVIIEKGEVLSAGSLDDLLDKQHEETPHRSIMVRAIDGMEDLHRRFLQMPHINRVETAGRELEIEIEGGDDVCANVLATLIQENVRVVEFRHKRADLEDLFMNVTKGEVQ